MANGGTAEGGDMVLQAVVAIPDLDELEDQVNQDGSITVPVNAEAESGGGSGLNGGPGGDEGTDAGGSGAMAGLAVEAGSDMATGGGEGAGMMGGMMGGLSKGALAGGAIAGLLLMLEPIQAALGGILRILELFVVPLAAALTPVAQGLATIVTDLIRFFRDPGESIGKAIGNVFRGVVNALIGAMNQIPGVNISKLEGPDSKPSKPGSGIQRSAGLPESNVEEPGQPFTIFDAFMMGPLEDAIVGKQGRLFTPQPGLSDESQLQRNQDQNGEVPDNFNPDMVI